MVLLAVLVAGGCGYRFQGGGTSLSPEIQSLAIPVFGNGAGEPCHSDSGFAASVCTQAWRWNVDSVVDTSGNAMSYWYTEETNHYTSDYRDRSHKGPVLEYTRGGYLTRIDYGQRDGQLTGTLAASSAPMWVTFDVAERCRQGASCGIGAV